jgi:Fe-S oxidoreductase
VDGPEEFHLVLVDNGRSRILNSDYAEALLCIRCGACLNHCPVFQEIGGHGYGALYAGPIGAVLTPLFEGINEDTRYLPQASSLCGACKEVCPVRIDIPRMLLQLRNDTVEQGKAPPAERAQLAFWGLGMSSPGLYAIGGKMARLATSPLARNGRVRRLPPPFNAWTGSRDFPAFAPQSFQERWAARHTGKTGKVPSQPSSENRDRGPEGPAYRAGPQGPARWAFSSPIGDRPVSGASSENISPQRPQQGAEDAASPQHSPKEGQA